MAKEPKIAADATVTVVDADKKEVSEHIFQEVAGMKVNQPKSTRTLANGTVRVDH